MNTTNKPFSSLAILLATLLCFFGLAAQAEEAVGPPGVLATFACNFNDGKDMDDLRSVRDYYLSEANKKGVSTPDSYVWTRFRGGVAYDHIWFDLHADLASVATDAEEWRNADMSKVDARFEALETCEANLATVQSVFQGSEAAPGSASTFVSSNACSLRGATTADDVADLIGHIGGVLGELDEFKSVSVFAATPVTHGPNSADVYLFSINPSPTAWAAGVAAIQGAPGGETLGRHFNATLDCQSSLWFAERVVGGDEE